MRVRFSGIPTSQKGAASGVATLDGNSWLTAAQAPVIPRAEYGDGSDGDVTIAGGTTLTRDMWYDNLTINNGVSLNINGWNMHVKGTLTNNGTIHNNGADGVAANGGAGAAGNTIANGGGGGNGGVNAVGDAGAGRTWSYSIHGVAGREMVGAGGAGGAATNAGGAGGTRSTNVRFTEPRALPAAFLPAAMLMGDYRTYTLAAGVGGGGGGGSGGVIVLLYDWAGWGTETVAGGAGGTGAGTGANGSAGGSGTIIKLSSRG